MKLFRENAVRTEKCKNNRIFIFNCIKCASEMRVQQQFIPKHSGLCVRCAQYDKPFKACYTSLLKAAKSRNHLVSISYEEFLKFTTIDKCHYCNEKIVWLEHTTKDKFLGKHSRSYKLDRKDSFKEYSVENCVVCCWTCNAAKGNRYSYEQWYGMTQYLRDLKESNGF